nr:hypothetical protein CFP56_48035 [Quercus suber]
MFHIELVIKMEALYSKLYDKYTKLKLSRGSRSHTLCNCLIKTDNYVAFKAKTTIQRSLPVYNASSKGGTAGYAMQGQVLALKRGGESWSCCKRYNPRNGFKQV